MTILNKQATFRTQTLYTTILLMLLSIFGISQCYGAGVPIQYDSCSDYENNKSGPGYYGYATDNRNNYAYEGEPNAGIVSSGLINFPKGAGHYRMYLGLGNNNNNNYSIQYSSEEEEENQIDQAPPCPYSANENPYCSAQNDDYSDYQSPVPVVQNPYSAEQNDDYSDEASAQEEAQRWKEEKKLLAFLSWKDIYTTKGGPEEKEGFTTTMLDDSEDEEGSVVDDKASSDIITSKMLGNYVTPLNNIIVVGTSNIISFTIICSFFCVLGYALKFPHFYLKLS